MNRAILITFLSLTIAPVAWAQSVQGDRLVTRSDRADFTREKATDHHKVTDRKITDHRKGIDRRKVDHRKDVDRKIKDTRFDHIDLTKAQKEKIRRLHKAHPDWSYRRLINAVTHHPDKIKDRKITDRRGVKNRKATDHRKKDRLTKAQKRAMKRLHKAYPNLSRKQLYYAVTHPNQFAKYKEFKAQHKDATLKDFRQALKKKRIDKRVDRVRKAHPDFSEEQVKEFINKRRKNRAEKISVAHPNVPPKKVKKIADNPAKAKKAHLKRHKDGKRKFKQAKLRRHRKAKNIHRAHDE